MTKQQKIGLPSPRYFKKVVVYNLSSIPYILELTFGDKKSKQTTISKQILPLSKNTEEFDYEKDGVTYVRPIIAVDLYECIDFHQFKLVYHTDSSQLQTVSNLEIIILPNSHVKAKIIS